MKGSQPGLPEDVPDDAFSQDDPGSSIAGARDGYSNPTVYLKDTLSNPSDGYDPAHSRRDLHPKVRMRHNSSRFLVAGIAVALIVLSGTIWWIIRPNHPATAPSFGAATAPAPEPTPNSPATVGTDSGSSFKGSDPSDSIQKSDAGTSSSVGPSANDLTQSPSSTLFKIDDSVDPSVKAAEELLRSHFDSINRKDFTLAWQDFTPEGGEQVGGYSNWAQGLQTTRDSLFIISKAEKLSSQLVKIRFKFTSTQDPTYAPDGSSPCLNWEQIYTMQQVSNDWKIVDLGIGSGFIAKHVRCA